MKVKLLQRLKHDGKEYKAGAVVELPDEVGHRLIGYRVAEAVEEEKKERKK